MQGFEIAGEFSWIFCKIWLISF